MRKWHLIITTCVVALVIYSCSTEKNTFISRAYHSTTAHYNGYFNANDLLKEAITNYRANLKEDYYNTLQLRPLPNEEEVKSLYTPIDTAIAKCTKVIQRHAMPSMDKPSQKKQEHNSWIDENWITIGVANYYRRDYSLALKNFEYAKRFFASDKSAFVAEMWMARTYIEEGKMTEAGFAIANLQKYADEAAGKTEKKKKTKSKKGNKEKEDGGKEPATFPKNLYYDFAITKALFFEEKKDDKEMIKSLDEALEHAKKSRDKARIHYILGQLNEKNGQRAEASEHYKKVLKYNAPFEMDFNARLKMALNGGGEKLKKDLNKLLRDTKNAEFKDQIYFTLALIAQNEGNEDKALENFTNSAFYSTSNKRQKGMAYEEMGDIYFAKKNYVKAQKYYDSCATNIPEDYPNYEGVKNKAEKLQALVIAVETAYYEDSVQRVAAMSESEREEFAEKLAKKIKEDNRIKKQQEAEKLLALQKQQQTKGDDPNGSKWYWNNTKAKTEGFEEFKRQWGQRNNENDWRRSEKIVFATFDENDKDSINKPTTEIEVPVDSLTAESLLADLPLTDSLLKISRDRMMSAYFDAGKIYQDQLNEQQLAESQFNTIISKPFESDYKLLAAYQIYRMYPATDAAAIAQKDYILTNYPTSDFAGYLRDPDYFLKKKERERQTEQEYLTDLERYEKGMYYLVVTKSNSVIAEQKDNPYRAKYYLLKARAQAKLNDDKTTLLPTLNELIAEFPGSPEATKAAEMKRIIEGGFSKNEAVDFTNKSIYKYIENEPMMAIIFLEDKVNISVAKSRVVDFNKEFFGRDRLNTSTKIYGEKTNIILVKEFPSETEAASYLSTYKRTKKHLLDLQKMKIIYISQDNLKLLFETQKLAEYELFFDEFY